jgi:hypothetical protein
LDLKNVTERVVGFPGSRSRLRNWLELTKCCDEVEEDQ